VDSPPVSALLERMLNFSDADIAESLGRQVAAHLGLPPTFAGTQAALGQVARRLGMPAGETISDASGLSRTDAVAPAALTTLLRQAAYGRFPQLRALIPALPVAGFTGTLAARFTTDAPAGVGRVRAKTGWLNGAAGLAGIVTTSGGRLLIFAALTPGQVRGSAEAALDRIAGALAACGCR
jgi:D-alanyl-D-alanine carboxypeptidase/D-alanyl-D-alanine-endopeptidase (penicillin-binding protein 4)